MYVQIDSIHIEEQKDSISEYLDNRFGRWNYDIHDDT